MKYLEMIDQLDVDLTLEQHIACAFLEGKGLRFGVDFGYDTAVAHVQELLGQYRPILMVPAGAFLTVHPIIYPKKKSAKLSLKPRCPTCDRRLNVVKYRGWKLWGAVAIPKLQKRICTRWKCETCDVKF